jgi:hypothetical protein
MLAQTNIKAEQRNHATNYQLVLFQKFALPTPGGFARYLYAGA